MLNLIMIFGGTFQYLINHCLVLNPNKIFTIIQLIFHLGPHDVHDHPMVHHEDFPHEVSLGHGHIPTRTPHHYTGYDKPGKYFGAFPSKCLASTVHVC